MPARDQALLLTTAAATVVGAVVFVVRRRRGSSRAVATFAAGCACGAALSTAFALSYDSYFPPRASIGLERVLTPVVTLFGVTVTAGLLSGVVYLLGARAPRGGMHTVAVDAEWIVAAARNAAERPPGTPDYRDDWRDVARKAAADSR